MHVGHGQNEMIQAIQKHSVASARVDGTDGGQNHTCLAGSWIKQWYLMHWDGVHACRCVRLQQTGGAWPKSHLKPGQNGGSFENTDVILVAFAQGVIFPEVLALRILNNPT
ncbi:MULTISPECIES: hypothetical protein [Acidithiobacillus]|uniref:hypothetical protein n=1 Tax=Acidithiobacillus TaxID=119977 RepID=UPI0018C871B2|nr:MULTISPECIES: hypothetical protein [Acidithiobacillus]MEB8487239.1 hypothetical protein [Acidithiobacillus ferriphilus]MEB8491246.1 hypothetical protein [Acidithiobacillus ferriphilus]MEB8492368.1 hypothetical protein [Acidithiobacillus ferriphilus]MEB8531632.1 hypothetical protein [Acidithiobacillus ferriphilus]MEB8557138.1 hypothetical protein [Acidithiobacillus ferriphilus]